MNFQNIQYFLQVARKRSFSQAAEELFITQQTLSASIAALERELGCKLFLRHIPLELTYGGERFLIYAKAFQQNYDHMLRDFAEIGQGIRGRLRIGVAVNRGRFLMPKLIHAFHETYPMVEVAVVEDKNDMLLEALHEGEIDMAIGDFSEEDRGIVLEDYYEDEIVLAVSDRLLQERFRGSAERIRMSLTQEQDVRLLAEVPFLMSSAFSVSGRIARKIVRQAGIVPEVKTSSGNMETLIEMCYLGEGACFCPEKLLRYLLSPEQLASMTMLRFRDGQTRYSVKFGWLDQENEWNIRSDFIRLAKQVEAL